MGYGNALGAAGRAEEAIQFYQKAIRLNPVGRSSVYRDYAIALRAIGRFEEAVSALRKAIQMAPDDFFAHIQLTATYTMMGREKEARAEAAEVIRINPKFSLDIYVKNVGYKDTFVKALRKAGLK